MKRTGTRGRRGRPPKFGRRGRLVAITLPENAISALRRLDVDLAWAIVRLLQWQAQQTGAAGLRKPPHERAAADSELVTVANGRSLIVVNRRVFKELPGVSLIPLHGDRAFLALDPQATVADLELAVRDRMEMRSVSARERAALAELRAHVRRWRTNPEWQCRTRSIIVVEHAR